MTGAAYAKALFDIAGDQETGHIAIISDYLKQYKDYQKLLDCGALSAKTTDRLIEAAFGKNLASAALQLMARRRQAYLWEDFAAEMGRLTELSHGILRAEVKTAAPLSSFLEEELIKALSRRTGKKITLDMRIEPDLLGGICIRAGGLFWDGTIRGRLRQLHTSLKEKLP